MAAADQAPAADPEPPVDRRRGDSRRDEHAGMLRSLAQVDWLVLLVVVLYLVFDRREPPSPLLLFTTMGAFAAFIVALRWPRFPVKGMRPRIALGAATMVAFITIVASQTGGPDSPLVNLYLLPVVLVAMTLGRRGTVTVFLGVSLAYLSVLLGQGTLPNAPALLVRALGELGPFALVAYLTQALADSIMTARRRIEEMAERDGLTGVLNLRTFRILMEREHQIRVRAGRGGYGILMVDMDQLKQLNDAWGHQTGNTAITTVAAAIQRAIRSSDTAARYGGDEFVIYLPDATPDVAETVAQRVRNNVYKSLFPVGGRLQRVTVSVGAASYPRDGQTYEEVLATADGRMYRDKELRRRSAAAKEGKLPAVGQNVRR